MKSEESSGFEDDIAADILMVDPQFFDVVDKYNPHMDPSKDIDHKKKKDQHKKLSDIYEDLGYDVHKIDAIESLKDMVFAANHGFAYEEDGDIKVLPSNMVEEERADEVEPVMEELDSLGADVLSPTQNNFEGSGDAMKHPDVGNIWVGYGQRTEKDAVEEIADRTGLETNGIKLETEAFYHLDTCFEHLDDKNALIHSEVIADEDVEKIRDAYDNVIQVRENEEYSPRNEAYKMAGNAHCPDGENVIIHYEATETARELEEHGYDVRKTDTSEYMKSGGSVYCMKLQLVDTPVTKN